MRWLVMVACLMAGPALAQQNGSADGWHKISSNHCVADKGPADWIEEMAFICLPSTTRDVKDPQSGQVVEVEVRTAAVMLVFYRGKARCEVALAATLENRRAQDARQQQRLERYR